MEAEHKKLSHEQRLEIFEKAEAIADKIDDLERELKRLDREIAADIEVSTDEDGVEWQSGPGVDFEPDFFSKDTDSYSIYHQAEKYRKYIEQTKKEEDKQCVQE